MKSGSRDYVLFTESGEYICIGGGTRFYLQDPVLVPFGGGGVVCMCRELGLPNTLEEPDTSHFL